MSQRDAIQAYKRLAERIHGDQISEEVNREVSCLPSFNSKLLEEVVREAKRLSLFAPHRAWALMVVADRAARSQDAAPMVKAQTAWHLGWAANEYVQPALVAEAIGRARNWFMELSEQGWAAACDWQSNALPWTRNNFDCSREELEAALMVMEKYRMVDMIPHCRHSLSYARLLTGDNEGSLRDIAQSEAEFNLLGDSLNQARCWLTRASILRRQERIEEALNNIKRAKKVFSRQGANVDLAKVELTIGLCHFTKADDFHKVIEYLNRASRAFDEVGLELWQAQCLNGLAQVHIHLGDISQAKRYLEVARVIFTKHEIIGLKGDNLNDLGWLERMRGRFKQSLHHFKQAEELYDKLGAQALTMYTIINQGKVNSQLARFQIALSHLERAYERLKSTSKINQLVDCLINTAEVWTELNQLDKANNFLDEAIVLCKTVDQEALMGTVLIKYANTLIKEEKFDKARDYLNNGIQISKKYHTKPQEVTAQRLLGEALVASGHFSKAQDHLKKTKLIAFELDMLLEQAFCALALGWAYFEDNQLELAQQEWEEVLKLSRGSLLQIEWRAYASMACLLKMVGDVDKSLEFYQKALTTITIIRRYFWQPALAGSYLQTPQGIINEAISMAALLNDNFNTLAFVECSKAQSFLEQVNREKITIEIGSEKLSDTRAEILLIQDNLRTFYKGKSRIKALTQAKELFSQLADRIDEYNELIGKIERTKIPKIFSNETKRLFDVKLFQEDANRILGKNWLALSYYITENLLFGVWVSGKNFNVWQREVTNRVRIALDACLKMQRSGESPKESDLLTLGELLIPEEVLPNLDPNNYLIIAPHSQLHYVPWSILQSQRGNILLVESCIPVVVPSLEALRFLWGRNNGKVGDGFMNGLLVALSSYQGRYPDLPEINNEIKSLLPFLGSQGHTLIGAEGTWENLKLLSQDSDSENPQTLSEYGFLHIASHIFSDVITGRMSGIALYDGDVWLDQLRDLAPLPKLISLSGCNGIQSKVFTGDEHMSLVNTCFLAGAQWVIGSLWPVLDNAATEIMSDFYTELATGSSPSQALAKTQRRANQNKMSWIIWGGFGCHGLP